MARLRQLWWLLVVFPVMFAASEVAAGITTHGEEASEAGPVLKWLSIPCLPILLALIAERVAERHSRVLAAVGVWIVAGVALVLILANHNDLVQRASNNETFAMFWPTEVIEHPDYLEDAIYAEIIDGFSKNWTVTGVLTREIITVVLIALAAGWALSKTARTEPLMAVVAIPVAVMIVLCTYAFLTPWAFVFSFDIFIADVILGSTFFELLFFVGPACPVGALALGMATLTTGVLLALWGGPRPVPCGTPVRAV